MVLVTEREHTFLSARLFFVATSTTEGSIEFVFVERLPKTLRFHDICVSRIKRIKVQCPALFVDIANDF